MNQIGWYLVFFLGLSNATFCYVMQAPGCAYLLPLREVFLSLMVASALQVPVSLIGIFTTRGK